MTILFLFRTYFMLSMHATLKKEQGWCTAQSMPQRIHQCHRDQHLQTQCNN